MDGLKRIRRIIIAPLAWGWRRFPRLTFLFSVIFVYFLVAPHFPECGTRFGVIERVYGPMDKTFMTFYRRNLNHYNVPSIKIGNFMFLSYLGLFSKTTSNAPFLNAAINANLAIVSGKFEGKLIAGKTYRMPDWLQLIRSTVDDEVGYNSCHIMRHVVSGKPPEGLFEGRWNPPTKWSDVHNIPRDVWEKYGRGYPYPY